MTILVTGAAGFIGFHVAARLLGADRRVVGLDNLNPYYDVALKQARLAQLAGPAFSFCNADVADREAMAKVASAFPEVEAIIHLAAQAGVRHSLTDPYTYIASNVMGQVVLLEVARRMERLKHFVYASSSSVYGGSTALPFSPDDRADKPNSLYAASKRADELINYAYAHLYRLPATGLRFFTVYGPWGRPDMAAFLFTRAILAGDPIRVFNNGEMWRDFTYIDDIVAGVIAALDRPPSDAVPHRCYNLGNNRAEKLTYFISLLEKAIGRPAKLLFEPMQPGDVAHTFADIDASRRDLGFAPAVSIEIGLPRFVAWYRSYYGA
jgi:UDP-glucuronate 4-epimerase